MTGHGGKRPGAGRPKEAASRANEQVRQEAAETGELPLAYMLRIMRDPSQPVGRRDEMAKAAAPFCHSRLSSVEHSGEIDPVRVTTLSIPAKKSSSETRGTMLFLIYSSSAGGVPGPYGVSIQANTNMEKRVRIDRAGAATVEESWELQS